MPDWCDHGNTVASILDINVPETIPFDQDVATATAEVQVNALYIGFTDPDRCSYGDLNANGLDVEMSVYVDGHEVGSQTKCVPNNAEFITEVSENYHIDFFSDFEEGTHNLQAVFEMPSSGRYVGSCARIIEKEGPPDGAGEHNVSLSSPQTAREGDTIGVTAHACCSGDDCEPAEFIVEYNDGTGWYVLDQADAPAVGCATISGTIEVLEDDIEIRATTPDDDETHFVSVEEPIPDCPDGYWWDDEESMCTPDDPYVEIPQLDKPDYEGTWKTLTEDEHEDHLEEGDTLRHTYRLHTPEWLPGKQIVATFIDHYLTIQSEVNAELADEEIEVTYAEAAPITADESEWEFVIDYEVTQASPIHPMLVHLAIVAALAVLVEAGISLTLWSVEKLVEEAARATLGVIGLLAFLYLIYRFGTNGEGGGKQ